MTEEIGQGPPLEYSAPAALLVLAYHVSFALVRTRRRK